MNGLEVGGKVGLSVLLPDAHELVLPGDHIPRFNLAKHTILEVRENLGIDHVVLRFPSVFPDAFPFVGSVDFYEISKPHIRVCVPLKKELPLPFLRVALALKAALHLLAPRAREIRVVEGCVVGSLLFVLVGGHLDHLLFRQAVELLLEILPADPP